MDPVLGTTLAALFASTSAVVIAVVNGRTNANVLRLEELVKRLKRRLIDKHGEDPVDVENI